MTQSRKSLEISNKKAPKIQRGWWFLKWYVWIHEKRRQHETWVIADGLFLRPLRKFWHSFLVFSYVHSYAEFFLTHFVCLLATSNLVNEMRRPTVGGRKLAAVEKKIAAIDMIYTRLDGSLSKTAWKILECNFHIWMGFQKAWSAVYWTSTLQFIEFHK